MPVNIKTASGGGIILQGANTASDKTMTVPADDGTIIYSNSSGNVGIGTSSPATKLEAVGTIRSSSGTGQVNLGITGGIPYIQGYDSATSGNRQLAFYTGAEVGRFDASGNFGIGTTSPAVAASSKSTIEASGPLVVGGAINAHQTNRGVFQYINNETAIRSYGATAGSGQIVFQCGGGGSADVERARIDSSGRFLVGTTNTDPTANRVSGTVLNSSGEIYSRANASWDIGRSSTSGAHITFYTDNGSARVTAGNISSNGSTTTYATSSDYRMKDNVQPMTGALYVVAQLKPCTYIWKDEFKGTKTNGQGFIAHELQSVVPDAVIGEKDAVDADGNPVYQGIDTSFLVATLTAGLQEAVAMIEELKAKVAALEAK